MRRAALLVMLPALGLIAGGGGAAAWSRLGGDQQDGFAEAWRPHRQAMLQELTRLNAGIEVGITVGQLSEGALSLRTAADLASDVAAAHAASPGAARAAAQVGEARLLAVVAATIGDGWQKSIRCEIAGWSEVCKRDLISVFIAAEPKDRWKLDVYAFPSDALPSSQDAYVQHLLNGLASHVQAGPCRWMAATAMARAIASL